MKIYQAFQRTFNKNNATLLTLVHELLIAQNIKTQNIEHRTKTVTSFLEKIDRDGKSYKDPIKEITDLSGLRIILFYLDDIDKVENLIKSEFKVDPKLSINKKNILDFDQFGYLSVHQIISLKMPRSALTEWKKFDGLVAEIQTRTVLQHAWASISHTLQYKNEKDIPKELRRQLHRLAGLFELSDEEFLKIKEKKEKLVLSITSSINTSKLNILLNFDSVKKYLETSELINIISKSAYKNGFIKTQDNDNSQLSILIKICNKLNIEDLDKLNSILLDIEKKSSKLFNQFKKTGRTSASPGHLVCFLILNAYKDEISLDEAKKLVFWDPNYVERIYEVNV
jgi:ppGpp synthetase/RelA/SpoT-type nucleotidyltranferase